MRIEKGEGAGTISGFSAACTALANTVGTGNISGVATAIVSGGPGALVWMWVSAFFGMSTKACEIILGQRYREHYSKSMDEYVCDRSFVLKNAFGMKRGAVVLAVFCFVLGPWTCCVQTEAVTSSIQEAFGIPAAVSAAVIGVTCLVTIWGGLRRIAGVMSRAVPVMAVLYIFMGLGVVLLNIQEVPGVIVLIFKSAFTPTAAVGGFAGATVRDAIQYGVARGIYSNDAGTGYGMIAHASAITDHPVRQSLWGWVEIFIDTMVICSITAFTIILTGAYYTSDATSGALTTIAFTSAYGTIGGKLTAIAIAVFAGTTIIGMYYTCEKSVKGYYDAYTLVEENARISGVVDATPFLAYFIENVYHKLNGVLPTAQTTEAFQTALSHGQVTEKEKTLWEFVLSAYGDVEFSTKQLEKDFGNAAYATIRSFVLKFEKLGLLKSTQYGNRVKYAVRVC